MAGNVENSTIPKDVQSNDDMDFLFLREQGIAYVESLCSSLWTDYNTHDPGITMLEVLCYAITDLGYRLSLPMQQQLSTGRALDWKHQFHLAEDILPAKAMTELDYRMLFMDCRGVRNAWIEPVKKVVFADCKNHRMSYEDDIWEGIEPRYQRSFELSGLNQVLLDLDGSVSFEQVRRQVIQKYHQNRNLCEDLVGINEVGTHAIRVCAVVEIQPTADEELIHAQIESVISNYFSPPVNFYDLPGMLAKGYPVDEVFEGPLLHHGFLDPNEVRQAKLRTEVRLSDIIKRIMNIHGVKLIKDIQLGDCDEPMDKDSWVVPIRPGTKPILCRKSKFNFYKGLLPLNVDQEKVAEYREGIQLAALENQYNVGKTRLDLPEGAPVDFESFSSIRNDFPENYGIGSVGLPENASVQRKAQSRQLKTYLHFFDQIFASYFKHLSLVKELLSVHADVRRTYFTQAIDDLGDSAEYLGEWYGQEDLDSLLMDPFDEPLNRTGKLKDHLLARFAERFSEYAFVMKKRYGEGASAQVLAAKSFFLKEYGAISGERGNAFNYYRQKSEQVWNSPNVSGTEKRICLLAGFKSYLRRHLSRSFVQLYRFTNTRGNNVYRWRMLDQNRSILLSATENYDHTSAAYEEIYLVVQLVLQVEREQIDQHFELTEESGYETEDVGCFRITRSPSGRYSFSIINPAISNPRDSRRIIASQYRYYSKANIKNAILHFMQFISDSFLEEGLFLVEHILLRPPFEPVEGESPVFLPFCSDDCQPGAILDPYSFRVTVVLPGNTFRLSDLVFRDYLENLIREELPSHILAKICWIGTADPEIPDNENPLVRFEEAFRNFLENLGRGRFDAQPAFVDVLSSLRSIYPTGSLYDCSQEDESGWQEKIILGRTNLGTI